MGAGKSTLGKNLARYTGARFIDLDEYLEKKFGCSVGDFFSLHGEAAFRREELLALQEILRPEIPLSPSPAAGTTHLGSAESESLHPVRIILSLGGGTVMTPACAKLIQQHTRCIYLNCPKSILLKRLIKNSDKRPLLAGKSAAELEAHISDLMEKREPVYKSCAQAEFEIRASEPLPAAVERICAILSRFLLE